MRSRVGTLAFALLIVAVILAEWAINKNSCKKLMAHAQTHSDSLVVWSSNPTYRGLSCQDVLP